MLSLERALISTKSRRLPFAGELQRQIYAARTPGSWRSAALIAVATAALWLSCS